MQDMFDITLLLTGTPEEGRTAKIKGITGKIYEVPVERVSTRQYMRAMASLQQLQDLMGPKYQDAAPGTGEWLAGLMRVGGTEEGEMLLSTLTKTVCGEAVPFSKEDILDEVSPGELAAVLLPFCMLQMLNFQDRIDPPKVEGESEDESEEAIEVAA